MLACEARHPGAISRTARSSRALLDFIATGRPSRRATTGPNTRNSMISIPLPSVAMRRHRPQLPMLEKHATRHRGSINGWLTLAAWQILNRPATLQTFHPDSPADRWRIGHIPLATEKGEPRTRTRVVENDHLSREKSMNRIHRKRPRHDRRRPAQTRRPQATVPPRRRRRPRPAPQPTPEKAAATQPGRAWKPVCPTAQRAYEVELFCEIE